MQITEWMTAKRWTCERLALQLGVSMTTVWKWRAGARPDYENIHKIRKLTRGRVKDEDWPPKGSRAHGVQGMGANQAQRMKEVDELLARE